MILFASTLLLSATLMFILQPLFGKLMLPLLGGSPAVWNTCMVFYQILLFFGYLYAHLLSTHCTYTRQIQIHITIVLISLMALPVALPELMTPPTDSNPTFWLAWTLLIAIGLPFFVLSATSPLMQKWFSQIGHHTSHDPYYLYVASNIGSLLALLSYPFMIEPNIGLSIQTSVWSIAYIALILLIVACAGYFVCHFQQTLVSIQQKTPAETLSLSTKLHYLVLAFVPSSLLLGLNNFVSTDIAAVPLLWVIPLALYLLSFVLVFSRWAKPIHRVSVFLQPIVILPFIAYSFINPAILPYWLDLTLHLSAFFLAVMVCHGELAKNRPQTAYLTLFYLLISFAGMLGGLFNTLVSPFIFNDIYEYPLMIVGALLLRPSVPLNGAIKSRQQWKIAGIQAIFPVLIFVCGWLVYFSLADLSASMDNIGTALILFVGLSYTFRHQPVSLALLTGVIIFFIASLRITMSNIIYQERTFFGVSSVRHSVLLNAQGKPEQYKELFHGTTKHGAQRSASHAQEPLTYYSRQGPMGQLFKAYHAVDQQWQVGVVGLGAGALACYAKPQQNWTFYEIDPAVVEIAKNPNYFTYLQRCTPKAIIAIGDARLLLQTEADGKFDLLVIDAFSSDSIPTHLLTQEALQLYFSKLAENGLLSFHITNRHLQLKKVLADHAKQLHYAALIQEFKPQQQTPLVTATDWFILAKNEQTLMPLYQNGLGRWQKPSLYFDMKPWTDDFTNIIGIWK